MIRRLRTRIGAVVLATLLAAGLAPAAVAGAAPDGAPNRAIDTALADHYAANLGIDGPGVTGQSLRFRTTLTLLDPDGDHSIPFGVVELSAAGSTLGTAEVEPVPDDPSVMVAEVVVTGLGLSDAPGAALTAGRHQVLARFVPEAGSVPHGPVEASLTVPVLFADQVDGPFQEDISWLTVQGIATGYAGGLFRPVSPVSRQAMAAFLHRAMLPGIDPEPCARQVFSDVPTDSPFCAEISWLATTGISTGWTRPGELPQFRPGAPVSRQAMAAFLYRLSNPSAGEPTCVVSSFADVPIRDQFCGHAAWLAERGISTGWIVPGGQPEFRPGLPVSRQAMAAFLHRLFGAAIAVPSPETVVIGTEGEQMVQVSGDPITGQAAVLPPGTPTVETGQYLAVEPRIGPDGAVSRGLLGEVVATAPAPDGSTVVTTRPATLDEAFESYSVVSSVSMQDDEVLIVDPEPEQTSRLNRSSDRPKGLFDFSFGAFDCKGASPNLAITFDLSDLRFDATMEMSAFGRYRLDLTSTWRPAVTVTAGYVAGTECTLRAHRAPTLILVLGGGLTVELKPALKISATGRVDLGLQFGARASAGITADNNGVRQHFSLTPTVDFTGAAQVGVEVFAGASLEIAIFTAAGLRGDLGPVLSGRWDVPSGCVVLDAGLRAELMLTLDLWIKEWTLSVAGGTFARWFRFAKWCIEGAGVPAPKIVGRLAGARVGEPYEERLLTEDNRAGSWTITGNLPPGINRSGARLSGTPTVAGRWAFRVRFDDGDQQHTVTHHLRVDEAAPPPGSVWAWGSPDPRQHATGGPEGQPRPTAVPGLSDITSLSVGPSSVLALRADRSLWAWGANHHGQLGDGSWTDRAIPVRVTGLGPITEAVNVRAGSATAYALQADGTVWAWGDNWHGRLGDGGQETLRAVPTPVLGLSGVVSIRAGFRAAYALKSDGTVWAWGANSLGQLGDGTTTERTRPVRVIGLSDVVAIEADLDTAYAIRANGQVWAWGDNWHGQLGNGSRQIFHSPTPAPVLELGSVSSVVAVNGAAHALRADGTLWVWGLTAVETQVGDSATTGWAINTWTPKRVPGVTGAQEVVTDAASTLVRLDNGTVVAWGDNRRGQLGDGTTIRRDQPVPVVGLGPVTGLVLTGVHGHLLSPDGTSVAALGADGTVWTWGRGDLGQLGGGSVADRTRPVAVVELSDIEFLAGHGGRVLAVQR